MSDMNSSSLMEIPSLDDVVTFGNGINTHLMGGIFVALGVKPGGLNISTGGTDSDNRLHAIDVSKRVKDGMSTYGVNLSSQLWPVTSNEALNLLEKRENELEYGNVPLEDDAIAALDVIRSLKSVARSSDDVGINKGVQNRLILGINEKDGAKRAAISKVTGQTLLGKNGNVPVVLSEQRGETVYYEPGSFEEITEGNPDPPSPFVASKTDLVLVSDALWRFKLIKGDGLALFDGGPSKPLDDDNPLVSLRDVEFSGRGSRR